MAKESKDAEWNDLAQKHEFLFGKKPRKSMKLKNLKSKVEKEIEKRDAVEETEEGTAINDSINEKLSELVELAKEAATEDGKPIMLALIGTKRGIHMSMIGEGQDAAIMVATSMASQPMINAVVTNAAMMAQMRRQHEQQMAGEGAPLKEEKAPEGTPTPQTEV
jgi:hypothetical protein